MTRASTGIVENEWKKLPHRQKYKHSGSIPRNALSPAKQCYAWPPRKCDYRTDRQTDRQTDIQTDGQTDAGQSDPYVPLCFAGDTKMIYSNNRLSIYEWCEFEGTRTCTMLHWNETFLFYITVQDVSVIFDKLWQHIDAQADWRRRWTYDRVPMQ